jgi:hypothetical protein
MHSRGRAGLLSCPSAETFTPYDGRKLRAFVPLVPPPHWLRADPPAWKIDLLPEESVPDP